MTLEERAAEAARNARCGRCRRKMLESGTQEGFLTGYYRVMSLRQTVPFQLCGPCGVELREFLNPALAEDGQFQALKKIILEGWSGREGVQGLQGGEGAAGRSAA